MLASKIKRPTVVGFAVFWLLLAGCISWLTRRNRYRGVISDRCREYDRGGSNTAFGAYKNCTW